MSGVATLRGLGELARLTLGAPRRAAQQLLSLGLERSTLRDAFLLVVVASGALMGGTSVLTGPAPMMPAITGNPVIFAAFLACGLGGMIAATTLVGRMLGGAGRAADLAVLLIWVQMLRFAAQALMVVLSLLPMGPQLSALLGLVASIAGLWITAVFIDEAHGFGNILKSLGVLVLAGLTVLVGLSLLWSLFGPDISGAMPYV